ncbi:hypothetical protein [Crocosphaera sp. UHCC 0190]|uniref:hypothetical protein n=1 Tax=Crocosphaera sp. UHCC 0190 TaxID=3110246 RepID=UPI002B1FAD33|nr:hypothetical protein [Crocosphaera sp. UHCC 0190]
MKLLPNLDFMTSSFSTTKLNEALERKRIKLEEQRQSLFKKTHEELLTNLEKDIENFLQNLSNLE